MLHLEQRKIQKVGQSTLSVSLPKDWLSLAGVKHGDTVYLDQGRKGDLRILSKNLVEEEEKPKEYYINCDKTKEPNLLERLIIGSYLLGVNTIKISSSTRINAKQMEEIRSITTRVVGLNIIEASQKEIILQCFIDPLKLSIYPLIKRLSVITTTMLDEAMEAFLKVNPELANDVIKREDEADNIYWLITRLIISAQRSQTIASKMGLNFMPIGFRLISKNLERIADYSENIAKIALNLHRTKDTIDERELETLLVLNRLTKEIFQKALNALFSRDIIAANEAINLRTKLDAEVEIQMNKSIVPHLSTIAIMLSMIAENSASIAAVALNIEINKSSSFPSHV
jgi:phosphate uptake regulator